MFITVAGLFLMDSTDTTRMQGGMTGVCRNRCGKNVDPPFFSIIKEMERVGLGNRIHVKVDSIVMVTCDPNEFASEVGCVVLDAVCNIMIPRGGNRPIVQVECYNQHGIHIGSWSSKNRDAVVRDLFPQQTA